MRNKKIFLCMSLILCLFCFSCGKKEDTTEYNKEDIRITNGSVDSSEDFVQLGLLVDVKQDNSVISDVRYYIENTDIAVVSFIYNGINCELRGSSVYKGYELVGKDDTSTGDIVITNIDGYSATYCTLKPGRVVFWEDENIYYSLYTYVTAEDSVLDSIIQYIIFENHYYERTDVATNTEIESKAFAEKIVEVITDKDLNSLSQMIYYPQQLGDGQSVGNVTELLNTSVDDVFTDGIIKAMSENAVEGLHVNDDGDYVIGNNYKSIYFRHMDDGTFLIVKINN